MILFPAIDLFEGNAVRLLLTDLFSSNLLPHPLRTICI